MNVGQPLPFEPWIPPAGVTAHNGEALDDKHVFFHPPPPEIGEVRTAYSTLKPGQRPRAWLRVLLAAVFTAPVLGIAAAFYYGGYGEEDRNIARFFIGASVAAFAVAFVLLTWKRVCTYTGANGVARFTLKRSLAAKPVPEMFLFTTAADLVTSSTHSYYNGIYVGTSYQYNWTDGGRKKAFRLKGRHSSKDSKPKRHDLYWYAVAAEVAWTNHKLAWVQQQLDAHGHVPFSYGAGVVRVGPGFFEFVSKGAATRIEVADIKHIKLGNGRFDIQHKDAKWFSGKGKFAFPYGSLTNARLFLVAMDRLTGHRFE